MAELEDFKKLWENSDDYIEAHTSGSTGRPKLIRLLKEDMRLSAMATCEKFNISSSSHLYLPLSPDYIAGKMQIVRSLVSGAEIEIILPSRTCFPHCRIDYDLVPIVPAQLEGLLSSGIRPRNFIIGGAALSLQQEELIKSQKGTNFYQTYGMTETCSHVALKGVGEGYYHAMPGIEFDITEDGRLIIRSEKMSFEELVTNDVVKLIDNQSFEFIGRADNVINSGGVKIHPEEVEKLMISMMQGVDFYVSSRKSEKWGEECILVLNSAKEVDKTEILKAAKALLGIKAPKDILNDPKPEYTLTGKLKRKKF